MPTPTRVLDLGANVGLTAAHYRTLWPNAEIVAVEMDADCADLAARNAPDVTVRCYAVSGVDGHGSYDPTVPADGYSFRLGDAGGKVVMGRTLRQTILRSFGRRGVDFVKMDVEGAEWSILERGFSWAPLVRYLLVELHPAAGHPDDSDLLVADAVEMLSRLGFDAARRGQHPRAVFAARP